MKGWFPFFLFQFFSVFTYAQIAPSIEWEKCLGGHNEDVVGFVEAVDGGYIIASTSNSIDGDVSGFHGGSDAWIVKLYSDGSIEWQKCLGGSLEDDATSIEQTMDGGFIISGSSESSDGDVSTNLGGLDYWIVKLNYDGDLIWQKSFGGSDHEEANSVQQTADGGYIVAGWSYSDDGDVLENHGDRDYWIVRLDSEGNLVWEKSIGGSGFDVAVSVQQISTGEFIVAGYTNSNDFDIISHGDYDYWVVKLDSSGNLIWQKTFGGTLTDQASSILEANDHNFIFAGYSKSTDGDVLANNGGTDCWIVEIDSLGNILSQKSLGGSANDGGTFIKETPGNEFIVSAWSCSNDGDVSGNHSISGQSDYWVMKLDVDKNLIWQKCLGGSSYDYAENIQLVNNSDYIVSGMTTSTDGDVTGAYGLFTDIWVVKLSGSTFSGEPMGDVITYFPIPVQNLLTITLENKITNPIISVYDLQGRMISLPATFQNNQARLNTSNLADGFYTLQIVDKETGKSEMGKFVKQ